MLFVDRPVLDDTGLIGRTYDLAEARPAIGFYLESLGAALVLVGAVAALVLTPRVTPAPPSAHYLTRCPPTPSSSAAPAAATATRSRRSWSATTRRCCACCRRMVGADAADAAQDAVVTALLSLDRLRDDDRFGAWLRRDRPQRLPRPTEEGLTP